MANQDLTAVAGTTFVVSNSSGDIDASEQHGVFAADTRFLSCFRMELGSIVLTLLSSGPAGFSESQIYLTNRGSETLAAQDLEVIRKRRLRRTGLTETIEITNRGPNLQRIPLHLWFDADFEDIFEVRSVSPNLRGPHSRIESSNNTITFIDTIRANQRLTRIQFSVAPDEIDQGHTTFWMDLEPHARWTIEVLVNWKVPTPESHQPVPVAEDIGHVSVLEWIQRTPKLLTDDDDLARAYERSIRDLGALEIALNSGQPIPAAGLPWYLAIFGRDSVITSLQTMLLNQRHARGTLRTLAAYQSHEINAYRDAEPGKIAHEIRFGELAISETVPHSRYYGSVDSTPLWLMLLGEYLRWVHDPVLLNDLLPAAEQALEWIERFGDLDGDGFIEYRRRSSGGLGNQGWKDSEDSIRFADGRMAEPPIALIEPQGYAYAARLAMADVYEKLGQIDRASTLRTRAMALKEAVQESFWMPDEGFFALALDGQKRQVDSVTSNPGHLLWSGLPDVDKAAHVVERLMAPDMHSGWGIRTMSTNMAAYNPISYHNGTIWPHDNSLIIAGMHRYGHDDAAMRAISSLIDATRSFPFFRLPELFCGYDRGQTPFPVDYPVACSPQAWAAGSIVLLVQVMLGIVPSPQGLLATPITDQVTGLNNVQYRGERFDVLGSGVQLASSVQPDGPVVDS
ncbi:MAG: glycogen debranching N-terminal domain-containing protein [Nitrolancea sp.]